MSYQNSYSTEERITEFLRSHPDTPVQVVVGYASVWGLAWLHRQTKGRRVHLLIGDMRKHHFARASDIDKQQALEFLARPDVEISNWYKKKPPPSEAHIKAWMIESPGKVAVLTGSANLTKQGIQHNRELMVEPSGKDLNYAVSQINQLFDDAWDYKAKLRQNIADEISVSAMTAGRQQYRPPAARNSRHHRYRQRAPAKGRYRSPASKKSDGCMLSLLAVTMSIALVVAITAILIRTTFRKASLMP